MKAINIIGTAYRATIEERDDTIVWVTHAMRGAAGDDDELDVLLRATPSTTASSRRTRQGCRSES